MNKQRIYHWLNRLVDTDYMPLLYDDSDAFESCIAKGWHWLFCITRSASHVLDSRDAMVSLHIGNRRKYLRLTYTICIGTEPARANGLNLELSLKNQIIWPRPSSQATDDLDWLTLD